jgi:hypothetical protein
LDLSGRQRFRILWNGFSRQILSLRRRLVGHLNRDDSSFLRSLSSIAVRDEAKEMRPDARPQARNNRRCIRWNTLRIVSGRERRRWLRIVCRSRTVNVGQAPRLSPQGLSHSQHQRHQDDHPPTRMSLLHGHPLSPPLHYSHCGDGQFHTIQAPTPESTTLPSKFLPPRRGACPRLPFVTRRKRCGQKRGRERRRWSRIVRREIV